MNDDANPVKSGVAEKESGASGLGKKAYELGVRLLSLRFDPADKNFDRENTESEKKIDKYIKECFQISADAEYRPGKTALTYFDLDDDWPLNYRPYILPDEELKLIKKLGESPEASHDDLRNLGLCSYATHFRAGIKEGKDIFVKQHMFYPALDGDEMALNFYARLFKNKNGGSVYPEPAAEKGIISAVIYLVDREKTQKYKDMLERLTKEREELLSNAPKLIDELKKRTDLELQEIILCAKDIPIEVLNLMENFRRDEKYDGSSYSKDYIGLFFSKQQKEIKTTQDEPQDQKAAVPIDSLKKVTQRN